MRTHKRDLPKRILVVDDKSDSGSSSGIGALEKGQLRGGLLKRGPVVRIESD